MLAGRHSGLWCTSDFFFGKSIFQRPFHFLGRVTFLSFFFSKFRGLTFRLIFILFTGEDDLPRFFLGIFLFKYRLELLLLFPALAVAFAWYLWLGMKPDSPAQRPERLWREGRFLAFLLFIVALAGLAFSVELPWLDWMLTPLFSGEWSAPG